jgi:3-hydroxyisobutyrate dehydrogenase
MGAGMARRLLAQRFPLAVFNRTGARAAPFGAEGARIASTPRDAASGADVILSMVADDDASRALWMGSEGALAGASASAVCIESSTVTVQWVRELAAAATSQGCEFLDAPVTGSKSHASAGELNFLVGGAAPVLERVRPVLSAMARSITLVGPTGAGSMLKLINNFVCGVQVVAMAEATAMLERSGLDRATALEVLTQGAPGSPLVRTVSARMQMRDYAPHFHLHLMAKDLAYALHEAGQLSVSLETPRVALAAFKRAIAAGHGEEDMAAVVEMLRTVR